MANQQNERVDIEPASPVLVTSYSQYPDAQAAVDRLSDAGFPVSTVSIVWTGLRRVEHVTGRRTVLTAAASGAISGAWFGTLLGLLLTVFVDTSETGPLASVVFTYLIVGALGGAIWLGVAHALKRGRRDFDTATVLDAESYELWVQPETYSMAVDVLQLETTRPQDPGPDPSVVEPVDPDPDHAR